MGGPYIHPQFLSSSLDNNMGDFDSGVIKLTRPRPNVLIRIKEDEDWVNRIYLDGKKNSQEVFIIRYVPATVEYARCIRIMSMDVRLGSAKKNPPRIIAVISLGEQLGVPEASITLDSTTNSFASYDPRVSFILKGYATVRLPEKSSSMRQDLADVEISDSDENMVS